MADVLPAALTQGFEVSAAHLMGVSALNAFVLRQALHRHHPLVAGSMGVLADTLFITLGTAGVGALLTGFPLLAQLADWGGAAFLFWHGGKAFRAAHRPQVIDARTPTGTLAVPVGSRLRRSVSPCSTPTPTWTASCCSAPCPRPSRRWAGPSLPSGLFLRLSPGTPCSSLGGPALLLCFVPPGHGGGWTYWWGR